MQIDTRKLKKLIIKAIPYVAFSYVGNLIGFAYRTAEGDGFQEKLLPFMSNLGVAFARIIPSLHPFDILFGLVLAGVMRLVLYVKSKNRKKFRQGEEYGSAVWGGEKDIEPYMDLSCPENNVILTKTESLTMGKPSATSGFSLAEPVRMIPLFVVSSASVILTTTLSCNGLIAMISSSFYDTF